jgi:hypothetical protein
LCEVESSLKTSERRSYDSAAEGEEGALRDEKVKSKAGLRWEEKRSQLIESL